MKSYFYIIQKYLGSNNIIQPCDYKHDFMQIYYTKVTCNNEKNTLICSFFYDFIFHLYKYNNFIYYDDIIYEKRIILNFFDNPKVSKFIIIEKLFKNIFYSDNFKKELLDIFCKIQKIYYAFCKLAFLYKYKKAKIQIKTDLFMNIIDDTKNNHIEIFQNNSRYIFSLFDLINIINTQLSYSASFIPNPKILKNPYNNMPFSNTILYNIYFYIKKSNYTIPELFQKFFECNFNLTLFKNNHEDLILEHSIKRFVYNGDVERLDYTIRDMLYIYLPKLYIDDDFPKNVLIDIMRPYLHLYMLSMYLPKIRKYNNYRKIMKNKLQMFYKYNKNFGRKYINFTSKIDKNSKKQLIKNITFDTKYIPFDKLNSSLFTLNFHNKLSIVTDYIPVINN